MAKRRTRLIGKMVAAAAVAAVLFGAAAHAEPEIDVPVQPVAFMVGDVVDRDARPLDRLAIKPLPQETARSRRANSMADGMAGELAALGSFQPNAHLPVCFRSFSNAPKIDSARFVAHYLPFILVRGQVMLATVPVNDACMSSGFGPRYGRPHKGIDLIAHKHAPIYSAGAGIVMEAGWARGYGNQVVIAHGNGVYTRYAHLHAVRRELEVGMAIGFGQAIGTMGSTGNSTGVHLHYEVLQGEWGPMKAYGLTAKNPLAFPAFTPARADVVLTIDARLHREVAR